MFFVSGSVSPPPSVFPASISEAIPARLFPMPSSDSGSFSDDVSMFGDCLAAGVSRYLSSSVLSGCVSSGGGCSCEDCVASVTSILVGFSASVAVAVFSSSSSVALFSGSLSFSAALPASRSWLRPYF